MLEINNVTYLYNEDTGIKNITLSIPDGCICGLIGMNGAGKTTLMKCVTGILQPQRSGTNVTAPNGCTTLVQRQS